MTSASSEPANQPAMGFWKCWSMSVGVMIGSGVFLLPAVLAPYGSISFLGWLLTSAGAITIALVLGRLASRTRRSGGFYVYTREAFGDLAGFIVGWSYWISLVFGVAAISVAFAGYAGAMLPVFGQSKMTQALLAASVIWTLTGINIKGVAEAASAQLIMTVLKIIPLLLIIVLGALTGSVENIPPVNPTGMPLVQALATTGLLTMWAFVGLEAGVIPAGEVQNPRRTIPRAVVTGTLTVAAIYIAATAAVMMLVPMDVLAQSEAPFADAARGLGTVGGILVTLGALVSTAGSLNGNILLSGQMPAAVASDGLAPTVLATKNAGNAPVTALIASSVVATFLLFFNYSDGLVAAFTFLISMSTLAVLMPYVLSALAELKMGRSSTTTWLLLSALALAYSLIAMAGAGISTLLWGLLLIAAGLPIFYWCRKNRHERES